MEKMAVPLQLIFLASTSIYRHEINMRDSIKVNAEQKEKFIIIEKRPKFPGGQEKFYRYIHKNLKYPKSAKKNGITGTIFLEFAINSDGSVDDYSVRIVSFEELNKLGHSYKDYFSDKECETEAIRLLKECPNWNPALQKGKPVKVKMIVPITFILGKQKNKK